MQVYIPAIAIGRFGIQGEEDFQGAYHKTASVHYQPAACAVPDVVASKNSSLPPAPGTLIAEVSRCYLTLLHRLHRLVCPDGSVHYSYKLL